MPRFGGDVVLLSRFDGVEAPDVRPGQSEETSPGASTLAPRPAEGRVYSSTRRVSIDDCAPSGRMEFDAIARFLQDVGNDDTDDAGFAELGLAWVARSALITVASPAIPRENLTLSTWCSGTGRRWAERRTAVEGEHGARIDAVTVWIHLDTETGRPIPWGDEFAKAYLPATAGRKVDSRLRLPKRPDATESTVGAAWKFRSTDSDAFGHVNNTAYLAVAEEFLDLDGTVSLEVNWRTPCRAEDQLTAYTSADRTTVWLVDDDAEETRAVFRVSTAATD